MINPHLESSSVRFPSPQFAVHSGSMSNSLLNASTKSALAMVLPTGDRSGKLLTPCELATIIDVKLSWIMDHVTRIEPIIPHIRVGRKIRFRPDVIDWFYSLLITKPTWSDLAEKNR